MKTRQKIGNISITTIEKLFLKAPKTEVLYPNIGQDRVFVLPLCKYPTCRIFLQMVKNTEIYEVTDAALFGTSMTHIIKVTWPTNTPGDIIHLLPYLSFALQACPVPEKKKKGKTWYFKRKNVIKLEINLQRLIWF